MNNKTVLLHLSLIDGVGAATISHHILAAYRDWDLACLYTFSARDISAHFQLPPSKAQLIVDGLADKAILEQELALLDKHGISWATVRCPSYPILLQTIHAAPPVLYWRGTMLEQNQKTIAFVGSRAANSYGNQVIDALVPQLVECDYAIISGGALGADSIAHRAALKAGGKTVAVLGAGLLMPYLASNRQLYHDMIERGGALISNFPLRQEAYPSNFPARNRIISGLSQGTLVVQAAAKSGALITARFAVDQGREVFAVPGPIHDPLSAGCHALIAQGAKLVATVDDILQELEGAGVPQSTAQDSGKQLSFVAHDASTIDHESVHVKEDSPRATIIRSCVYPCSMDDLVEKTGLDAQELQGVLFELQLEGKVKQNFMGLWEKG